MTDPRYSEIDEYYDDGPFDGDDLDRKGIGDPYDYELGADGVVPPRAIARGGVVPPRAIARNSAYRDTVVLDGHGVDRARQAHYRYADARAERLDGDCERIVRVRRGETLSDIAEFCDVPIRALIDANGYIDPHRLEVGQRLRVPAVRGEIYDGVAFDHTTHRRTAPAPRERVVERVIERPVIVEREVPVERAAPTRTRYEPLVRVAPERPRLGDDVQIAVQDLPPNSDIIVLIGADRGSLRELHRARTDTRGRWASRVRFDEGYQYDQAIIAVRAPQHDITTYTDPYPVLRDTRRSAYGY